MAKNTKPTEVKESNIVDEKTENEVIQDNNLENKLTDVTEVKESNEEEKVMAQNKEHLVVVPIDSLNPSIKTIPVFVNDDKYEITLGKQTTVNQDVYDVLKSAGYIIE